MATDWPGVFTISLDFELAWGFLDRPDLAAYEANLRGGRTAVPAMLDLFEHHGVHATWATVGLLMHEDRQEFLANVPELVPTYDNPFLDPYRHVQVHQDLDRDLYLAPELVNLIRSVPGQEIGSHTYCHYYCLEPGQTREQFQADLLAAVVMARRRGLSLRSLVFPRNQSNPDYFDLLPTVGIECYRGNEQNPIYRAASGTGQKAWMRATRLLDSYLPLTGHNTYKPQRLAQSHPYNVPASRFLRPHFQLGAWLEPLRRRRITRSMTHAARSGHLFHLWWHPHNFGRQTRQNLTFLSGILEHFETLRQAHGMVSLNMGEVATMLDGFT